MIRRSYASDHAELREGLMALERAAAFVPPEPNLVEKLVNTLIWVRKNYGGDIREINARIDAAIARAKTQGGGQP
jgi:hypothetical protein